jgi:hypothetical protein
MEEPRSEVTGEPQPSHLNPTATNPSSVRDETFLTQNKDKDTTTEAGPYPKAEEIAQLYGEING